MGERDAASAGTFGWNEWSEQRHSEQYNSRDFLLIIRTKNTVVVTQGSCAELHPPSHSFTKDFHYYNMLLMTGSMLLHNTILSTMKPVETEEAHLGWVNVNRNYSSKKMLLQWFLSYLE